MRLRNWLTDLFGVECASTKDCLNAVRILVKEKIAANWHTLDLEAKSNQIWEDIQFRNRVFRVKRDEAAQLQQFETKTGKKHNGFFGTKFYPPYTIWHRETARYIDRETVDREWDHLQLT